MELRHLRYFLAVAEEGSIHRAALRLQIQPPPLSQQIRALEAELGVELFLRAKKRLTLNAAGQIFLEGTRRTLEAARDAAERVQRFDSGEQGRLAIGLTSSASLHGLTPRIMREFRRSFQAVTLGVQESENYELILALQQERLDAALLRIGVGQFPTLTGLPLAREPVMLALPSEHALAQRRELALGDLAEEDLVLYRRPDGPGIADLLLSSFEAARYRPRIVEEVTRMIAAINLVAAGRGITFVPRVMQAIHPELVAYRELRPGQIPQLPLNLVVRKSDRSTMLLNFVRTALDCADAHASASLQGRIAP